MRTLHKSEDHKLGPGKNLTVNFVTKLGQAGIGSTHKSAQNNLRPTWIHPLLRKGQTKFWHTSFAKGAGWLQEQLIRVHTIA